ncbi:hypothetical protein A4A49_30684 [Nicotiana attenuata]|uniref:Retrotransposon gag domain-containing protein n=1 Tax=Nicotiana attenuata TaxID=49451 RepID=A0A314KVW6_NICAT|nr:hypothetical protein A4A49_30684 [Nicotiana attenuata]
MGDQKQLKALVDESVREATDSFSKELAEIRCMLLEFVGKQVHDPTIAVARQDNTPATPTLRHKPSPVELGRFRGEKPDAWVFQAERYFDFYKIEDSQKLTIASFYLDGEDLKWYHWLFRNKQLAVYHSGCLSGTSCDYFVMEQMANLPLPQYWNVPSENTNLNITHKVFAEKPNRETKTVRVTEMMLTTPEETCNSVLEEDKEEFEPRLPQYLVEPSEYNSNNEVRKLFDELSDWSKNAMQEPQKELTLTTETHIPNGSMYHVAPIDAANNNANVVENEDKNNKEKVVTAIIEKDPLYIGSAFSIYITSS